MTARDAAALRGALGIGEGEYPTVDQMQRGRRNHAHYNQPIAQWARLCRLGLARVSMSSAAGVTYRVTRPGMEALARHLADHRLSIGG